MGEVTVTMGEGHQYFAEKNGRRWALPGVSFLLEQKFGKNAFFRPHHAHRGSMVHRACSLDDQGVLDEKTVAPELRGYLDAWRLFKQEKAVQVLDLEFICFDTTLGYAGTADRLIAWSRSNRPCVVDIKSGGKAETHWLQLGAYVRGMRPWEDIVITWRDVDGLIVYVKPTGKYTMDFYEGDRVREAVRCWEVIPREYAQKDSKIDW